jgi:hypothetical protein
MLIFVLSTSFSAGNILLNIVVFGVVPLVMPDVVSYMLFVSLSDQVAERTPAPVFWFFHVPLVA